MKETIMDSKSFIRILLILLVPAFLLLAARIFNVVNFSLLDYVIVYVLLAGAGLVYALIPEKRENVVGWIFGTIVFAIGVINTFWETIPFLEFLFCFLLSSFPLRQTPFSKNGAAFRFIEQQKFSWVYLLSGRR